MADNLPKNTPILSISKNVDMWTDDPEAVTRRAKAQEAVRRFRTLWNELDLPEGWSLEIHG